MSLAITEEEYKMFHELIYKHAGIYFSDINRAVLISKISERVRKNGFASAGDYYKILQKNKDEFDDFIDFITTNLTFFFRNKKHFDILQHYILPDIARKKLKDKKLKLWSAGCSTGEEAYSLAITVMEAIPDIDRWDFVVLASDISIKSLMFAKEGIYEKQRVSGVPKDYLDKYFDKVENDKFKVKDFLKEKVRFDFHNLKFDSGQRNFDIIFCRNVLIYFDKKVQKEIVDRFYESLNDDGYLFIGHAESLIGLTDKFRFERIGSSFCYRKVL